MSTGDHLAVQILTKLVQAADGAVIGIGLAYIAVRSLVKYVGTSSALCEISAAPSTSVSGLRSLLTSASGEGDSASMLVIARGTIEAKATLEGGKKSFWPSTNALRSRGSGESAVFIQRSQSCIYNEWPGFFPWTSDLKSVVSRLWREEHSYKRSVPFVLYDKEQSDHVVVDLEGSKHPLPLETVFHEIKPVQPSPYSLFQAFFGREYPIGLLDEEKILRVGKDITVVGMCCSKDGALEIKSRGNIPYFLTDLSKEQMMLELMRCAKILKWTGIIAGSVSIGILGYSIVRNWRRCRAWNQTMMEREELANQLRQQRAAMSVGESEDDGEVPEGELCVVCLSRRNQSAFVPCGHKVCCQECALTVEHARDPSCPICRQTISGSLRIYGS